MSSVGLPDTPADVRDWRITSVAHEDGSGHSFNLGGYCSIYNRSTSVPHGIVVLKARFSAYYNAKTRNGRIQFFSD